MLVLGHQQPGMVLRRDGRDFQARDPRPAVAVLPPSLHFGHHLRTDMDHRRANGAGGRAGNGETRRRPEGGEMCLKRFVRNRRRRWN